MKVHELFESANHQSEFAETLNDYFAKGEIVKPRYEDLKYQINRAIDKAARSVSAEHTHGRGLEYDKL